MIGSTLSHYRITARIGAGGMGEVYRAEDTTLGRDVALKLLPPGVSDDPDRLARFEREAKLLAALNHPNIAQVHGFDQADGQRFLVLELVEGEDLSERLSRGPIPADEAVAIARQIAEALEQAHGKGIVHRDLKPANVKLTPDGRVKVLDFGLAKAWAGETDASGSSFDLSRSPTLAHTGTQAGIILGTAAYMSPEQARGKPVDKRADLWAFGVVLFEMLTGRSLFAGDTVSDVLAGVLKSEPEWDSLPPGTPRGLLRLLRTCLERDPRNRLHDAADARIALDTLDADDEPATLPAAAPTIRRREALAWGVAAVLAVAVMGLALRRPTPAGSAQVIRSAIPLPPGVRLELDGERAGVPAVSPDGTRLAFGAREGAAPTRIWIHDLASGVSHPILGTEGAYRPFWSPDGQSVGFFTWSTLATVPVDGGALRRLAPARDARGGSWSPNGTIVFSPHASGPVYAVPARGGAARPITGEPANMDARQTHRYPQFLPDGEHFVFLDRPSAYGPRKDATISLGQLASSQTRPLLELTSNAVYAAGHLLYVQDGALVARGFDASALAFTGEVGSLVADLLVNPRFSFGVFSASDAGPLVFMTGTQADQSSLVWRDRAGRRLGELGTPGTLTGYGGLAVSNDGRWAATGRVDSGAGDADIWLYSLDRNTETRLVRSGSDETDPAFSPDSRTLYFHSISESGWKVVERRLDGGQERELWTGAIEDSVFGVAPMSVTPDGRSLVYEKRRDDTESGIETRPLDQPGETRVLVATGRFDSFPQLSPDGRWLAWVSDESGEKEVYVASFPDLGTRVQVTREGGNQPRWNPNGHELYFQALDNTLTAVPVDTRGGSFSVGAPEELFQIVEFYGWTYTVAPDGERFLVREPIVEEHASPLTILTHWTSLLAPRS